MTSLSFQYATRRVGSLAVNVLRLVIAFFIYALVSKVIHGYFIPIQAPLKIWKWMSFSGIVGFIFGDYFLFLAFKYIDARISMLIMSFSPPLAAFISWFFLGETLSATSLMAIIITLAGIMLVIFERKENKEIEHKKKSIGIKYSSKGIFYAFLGAIGQSSGLVISKYGMAGFDTFSVTQIRIIAGVVGYLLLMVVLNKSKNLVLAVKDNKSMIYITFGAVFGPFLGVYLSLLSVKYAPVGIASTLMSVSPLILIPISMALFKEKINKLEIIGSVIAILGISLFFMN